MNDNVLYGIACPKCEAESPFNINGWATFLMVNDDGCSEFEGMEWDEECSITCKSCGHTGIIADFTVYEDEDEDEDEDAVVMPLINAADIKDLPGCRKKT